MNIPDLAKIILNDYDGYLVGSAAEMLYISRDVVNVKDYDLIIPPINWNDFMKVVPNYTFLKFKRLGGIKLEDYEYKSFDIWSMDLGQFYNTLPEIYSGYALNKHNEFIKRL